MELLLRGPVGCGEVRTGRSSVQQRPPDVARAMITEPRVELLARDAGIVQNLLLFRLGGIRRVDMSRGQEPGS